MIPDHEPLAPDRLLAMVEDEVGAVFGARVLACDDRRSIDGDDLRRRTPVPFFKICLEGGFDLPACETRASRRVARGDALLFLAGSYANDVFPAPCRFFRATFHADMTMVGEERIRRARGRSRSRVAAHCCLGPIGPCGRAVLEELGRSIDGGEDRARANLVRVLIDQITQQLRLPAAQEGGARRHAAILHFLREHCGEAIGRDHVARALGLSPSHVSRLCRHHGARGFNAELTDLRLALARELLHRSDLPVDEVARRSGFAGGNYFAQAFRAAHGCSPSAWRMRS